MKKLTCDVIKSSTFSATGRNPKELYTICWDCLIELDINHKNFKKYKKNLTRILVSSYLLI